MTCFASRWAARWLASAALFTLVGCTTVPLPPDNGETGTPTASSPDGVSPYTLQAPRRRSGPVIPSGPLQNITVESPSTPPAVATLAAPQDLWERMRRGFRMANLEGDLVRDREQWYAARPEYMQRMVERASKYMFHIVEEIERRDLPMELALLPFIESAFNPQAVSPVKAAGMWQFMPATGQSFDLKQNAFRDDRRDVLASTKAALDYLEQLYKRFGDWHLALAAYNWGQGNVNKAITRNRQAGKETGYTDLTMPMETRQYVPKLQAVENLVTNPAALGAKLPLIGNHPFFDTVNIERDMDVSVIAQLAEVSEADFRLLNPSAHKPVILASGRPTILLPWDNAAVFERNLQTWARPLASWTAWVVPTGMTTADAAKRHGISDSELREINKIPPRMRLQAGSTLLVPRTAQLDRDVPEHVADNGKVMLAPDIQFKPVTVKARKGDTVAKLADRYKVPAAQVANWNGLTAKTALKAGQALTIQLPVRAAAEAAKAAAPSVASKTRTQATTKPQTSARASGAKSGAKSKATRQPAAKKRVKP
jgi:membrane-bound lytic murein transglycosylase D